MDFLRLLQPLAWPWWPVALALGMGGVGCRTGSSSGGWEGKAAGQNLVGDAIRRAVQERVETRFDHALFITPPTDAEAGLSAYGAPLLVQECPDPATPGGGLIPFGRIVLSASQPPRVDPRSMTVYHLSDTVSWGGREYELLTFVWFYPPADGAGRLRYRGYRVVLDEEQIGLVWEVLDSEAPLRVFHVSETVEAEAILQRGGVLPGRRYVVEPPLEEHPEVVVARVLSREPAPMGPFVYLGYPGLEITTLLCRCMPSQVGVFTERDSYRLVRLREWSDLGEGRPLPAGVPVPPPMGLLDGLLRVP